MGFQYSAHRGFGNPDPMIALQIILNPQRSELIFFPEFQDFLHNFRNCPAWMMIGDGSFSIQASLSCFLVFLFPTIIAGTREIELPAGFGNTQMSCKFHYDQLEPDTQFFPGFFVHTILLFVA